MRAASCAAFIALFSSVLRYCGIRPVDYGKSYEPGPGANVFLTTVSFLSVPKVPAILILGSI